MHIVFKSLVFIIFITSKDVKLCYSMFFFFDANMFNGNI